MRVAILGSRGYPYVYSGYETFVAELAPRLAQRGHDVTVYCHRGLFADRPPTVNGVRLVYVPAVERKILSQFTHSFLATLHAATQRYDVLLYVNAANGPFGAILRLARCRTAINVDGLEWLRPKWHGLGSRYFRAAASLATKLFDVVITDAEAMAEVYRREFGSSSTTIPYGATITHSIEPERVRAFGVEPREYYLVVGRLVPDNNAGLIVQGFAQSASRKRLLVVGDVPYRDSYAERVRATSDSRIIFLGYVRDQESLRELYCNAYAYLHGHEYGGTNPALLRALAGGCCVLALDTPFSREVLDGERYGIYFDKKVEGVRGAIEALDQDVDRVRAYRERARTRIADRYTWERITEQYEGVLTELGGQR